MKNSKIKVFALTAMMASGMFFQSCSKEGTPEVQGQSGVELIKTSESIESERKESIKEIATSVLGVMDKMLLDTEMVAENQESFTEEFGPKNKKEYSVDDVTEILAANFGTDTETSKALFILAYEHREILAREGSQEALFEELARQLEEMKGPEGRWIFSLLHAAFAGEGTHCSLAVLAHIADAMVLTAGAALTAPTGIGAVILGGGVVSSVGQATIAASNCS